MKRFIRAASAGLLLAAIALPVSAEMPDRHISDDAEYRQSQLFKSRHEAAVMRNATYLTQPDYLSKPRHISDDAEYRQAEFFESRPSTRVLPLAKPAYLSAPHHISDDAEYRQSQLFK